MNLHNDKGAFEEILAATAAELNFEEFQIEKDYYVSLLLKKLAEVSPEIVFKGGTSLSKCYDVINRFSEDIDINLKVDTKVNNKQREKLKKDVQEAINEVGFELLNDKVDPPIEIRSRGDQNNYLVGYPKTFEGEEHMVGHIIVETSVTFRAFPCKVLEVSNYITKYLISVDEQELIGRYGLEPFKMQVQTVDRTFLDKIFALCDYYEDKKVERYSRHLYDIHMIWNSGMVNLEDLKELLPEVIEVRKPRKATHSAKSGYELAPTLQTILETDYYKNDFDTNTQEFLSKEIPYADAKESLQEILDSGFLPRVIQ